MDETPNLNLSYIMAAQAQKHVTHNEAIRDLDALVHLSVLDRDLTVPPGSPSDGDRYMVATGGTGAWTGKDGKIAAWQDGAWAFHAPQEGWVCWIADEDILQAYDGSAWGNVVGSTLQNLSMLGINATADTTNRLSVETPAVLFNNESGDIQAKLNKAAVVDTASFLFQTNWSGRAEIGLTGDDNFHFKVSPDGTNWSDPLVITGSGNRILIGETYGAPANANRLHIRGGHVGDGGNDYGLTIEAFEPAITLVDQSTGGGQGQIFGGSDGSVAIRTEAGNNDGTIGHNASSSWKTAAVFRNDLHRMYVNGEEVFRLEAGQLDVPAIRSGRIIINSDAVGEIFPPNNSGIVCITFANDVYPQMEYSGIFAYDTGLSPYLVSLVLGASASNQGSTVLTGTTGPDGKVNVSAQDGKLLIENRYSTGTPYSYTFIGG